MLELAAIATATRSPVFLAHVLAVGLCLAILVYARRHGSYAGAASFAVWLGANAFWIAGYAVGFLVSDHETRLAVTSVAIAAIPIGASAWLVFTLAYSGRWRPRRCRFSLALAACTAVLVLFLLTNPIHRLAVDGLELVQWSGVTARTGFSARPGFWLVMAYVYTCYLIGSAVLFDLVLSSSHLYRDQIAALLVVVVVPLAVASSVLVGVFPYPVDPTPLSFGFVAVPLAYSVFRTELLELVPASTREGEQTAIETLDQGVLVLDPADRVVFANASFADLVGAPPQSLVGQSLEEVLVESPFEAAPDWTGDRAGSGGSSAIGGSASGGRPKSTLDDGAGDVATGLGTTSARVRSDASLEGTDDRRRPIGDDGEVSRTLEHTATGRTYEVMESQVDEDTGPDLGRTLFFRDVTDERRRKQRLLVLNRVVRHNLRNDMNVLRGHVRLLEDVADDESVAVIDEIATDLIHLGEKAHQMDRIIREAGQEASPVNVAGIVDRVVKRHDEPSTPPIAVRGPAQAWTRSHGPIVEAIVSNLVENAVEHAPWDEATDGPERVDGAEDAVATGGRSVDFEHAPVTVEIEDESDGGVTLTVSDDGPGIPEQEVATLMGGEVSALQHGSGIGLWMVKWCVDLANGTWSIENDGGARVTVSFPSASGEA